MADGCHLLLKLLVIAYEWYHLHLIQVDSHDTSRVGLVDRSAPDPLMCLGV